MSIAAWADLLQVVQTVLVIVGLIVAIGVWRARTESAPGALAEQMKACRQKCDGRFDGVDREVERLIRELENYARKDTIGETLKGMDIRLANIERALRIGGPED